MNEMLQKIYAEAELNEEGLPILKNYMDLSEVDALIACAQLGIVDERIQIGLDSAKERIIMMTTSVYDAGNAVLLLAEMGYDMFNLVNRGLAVYEKEKEENGNDSSN